MVADDGLSGSDLHRKWEPWNGWKGGLKGCPKGIQRGAYYGSKLVHTYCAVKYGTVYHGMN